MVQHGLASACVLAGFSGCGDAAAPAPKVESVVKKAAEFDYPVVGIVRAVDPATLGVTIKHEAIDGYMPSMTMPFRVRDKALLDDVQVGDKVAGTLAVKGDDSFLTKLEVTEMAPPPTMTLNLGKGGATLKATPARLEIGQEVPDFALTTQEGKPLRLSELRGKVVVLTFIYTRCPLPNFCPAMDRRFSALASLVGAVSGRAEKVRLLSISFDPEHDTPEVLSKHAKLQGAAPPLWTFAVAQHEELSKVAAPLGLMYGPTKDEIIHNLTTAVIGPDGRLARLDVGGTANEWTAPEMLKTVASLLP
ncbi:SCO family protein [Isosphaeraceae bacterium EP7]